MTVGVRRWGQFIDRNHNKKANFALKFQKNLGETNVGVHTKKIMDAWAEPTDEGRSRKKKHEKWEEEYIEIDEEEKEEEQEEEGRKGR